MYAGWFLSFKIMWKKGIIWQFGIGCIWIGVKFQACWFWHELRIWISVRCVCVFLFCFVFCLFVFSSWQKRAVYYMGFFFSFFLCFLFFLYYVFSPLFFFSFCFVATFFIFFWQVKKKIRFQNKLSWSLLSFINCCQSTSWKLPNLTIMMMNSEKSAWKLSVQDLRWKFNLWDRQWFVNHSLITLCILGNT